MRAAGSNLRARRAAVALGVLAGLLAMASTASAANMFTLDAHADGLGHVVMDGAGDVYVAWNRTSSGAADIPMFCKFAIGSSCTSPVSLSLPGGSATANATVGNFPIVVGSFVYVVGPRYVDSNTVVWTSTDGGATFSAGTVIANGYNQTDAENVLLQGSNLLIAGVNVGLSFDSTPLSGTASPTFVFNNAGPGGVASGSLGVDQNGNPVEAYWNLSSPAALNYYYYNGSGNPDLQTNWTGPVSVGTGQTPSLAGGSGGLYLLSADGSLTSNPNDPTAVDVRTYNATSHAFGAPVTLLTNPASGFDEGGGVATTPNGKVVAIWPDVAGGNDVLDSFVSTNGGASFTGATRVATRAASYGGQASVAAIDQGTGVEGVIAFDDAHGLELANLTPIIEPTTLATAQTSGAVSGTSLTVPDGTVGETDRAAISGANASSATGAMGYALYSSSSCAAPSLVFNGGAPAVAGGVAGASAGVSSALAPGTYYWQAVYSGDALNAASASTCGSEVLTVAPAPAPGGSGVSNGKTITVTVTCTVAPCTVTITITVDPVVSATRRLVADKKKIRHRTITIASGKFTLKKSGANKVAVKLTKAGKNLLKKDHGHLKAKILVSTTVDGHVEKVTKTIHITTSKHHKK